MAKLCTLLFSPTGPFRACVLSAAILAVVSPLARATSIPLTQAIALDGRAVSLPHDLPAATVIILGFTRQSQNATTAWERPTRTQLAHAPAITFYNMAMLAGVPRLARGFALRSIRKAVPDVLKPNFLPLLDHEAEWKQTVAFDSHAEDAAYVLLVDRTGAIRWSTHEAFTPTLFAQLTQAAQALAKPQP